MAYYKSNRLSEADIDELLRKYADVPTDDVQLKAELGLNIAMVYLSRHDRAAAAKQLSEMASLFEETDPDVAARCREILSQLDE